jgi:hypothetical protein
MDQDPDPMPPPDSEIQVSRAWHHIQNRTASVVSRTRFGYRQVCGSVQEAVSTRAFTEVAALQFP